MMQRVDDAEVGFSGGGEDAQHVRNAVICLRNDLDAIPDLAALGDEIGVWVDKEECGERFFVSDVCHLYLRSFPKIITTSAGICKQVRRKMRV